MRESTAAWCPKTAANARGIWRRYVDLLGDRELARISQEDVESLFLDTREKSPAWANYRRAIVRGFFSWAFRRGMATCDPTVDVWPYLPDPAEPTFRTVSRDEELSICRAAPTPLARYVTVAIATGLRRGTLYQSRWGWVSPDWMLIVPARAAKNRRPLRIPLNNRAIVALGARKADDSPLLPGLPGKGRLNWKIQKAARKAGVDPKDLTSHQFRRTWVERFRDAGGTREECQLIQGWQSANVLLTHYWPRVPESRARAIVELI